MIEKIDLAGDKVYLSLTDGSKQTTLKLPGNYFGELHELLRVQARFGVDALLNHVMLIRELRK